MNACAASSQMALSSTASVSREVKCTSLPRQQLGQSHSLAFSGHPGRVSTSVRARLSSAQLPKSNQRTLQSSLSSRNGKLSELKGGWSATCKTRRQSRVQPIRASEENGRGEKRKPNNKMTQEPTLGDKIQVATAKLFNVTAYPLGIAGLATLLPIVWTYRLYKMIATEPMDMKDKVVLISGASSGIGEHIAYEYARLGARLALVARRGEKLEGVAEECKLMGAPDAIAIQEDLGVEENCKAAIDATLKHYNKLDALSLNAGFFHSYLFGDADETKRFDSVMDVNFWGYVYMTYYALDHLKKTNGQIIVNSSVSSLVPQPRNSIYNASKAAVTNFFHTLRIELGDDVPITIFSPGVTKSELSDGKIAQKEGKVPEAEDARRLRNEQLGLYPIVPTAYMAREAVKAARLKKHDIILPVWYNMLGVYRALAPEVLDIGLRYWLVPDPPVAKRILDTFNVKIGQPSKEDYEKGGIPVGKEEWEKQEVQGKRGKEVSRR